ncbi:MAG: hypothetical protein HC799_10560 [Limnothrix sp. RL_2_0]|nr:hypothetical protein [Limnothrix sp. RL_2_0]
MAIATIQPCTQQLLSIKKGARHYLNAPYTEIGLLQIPAHYSLGIVIICAGDRPHINY